MGLMRGLLTVGLLCGAGVAGAQTCNGEAATIIAAPEGGLTEGTDGNDVILGSDARDIIEGNGGNDLICGGGETDEISGGDGDDLLIGDDGDDVLLGGAGTDSCDGSAGTDAHDQDCEEFANTSVTILDLVLRADDGMELAARLHIPGDDPVTGTGTRSIAWLITHGSTGSIEGSVPRVVPFHAVRHGLTTLSINRRNCCFANNGATSTYEDATLDLGAGVNLLMALGYDGVFVSGHSQGTGNAATYPSLSMDPNVVATGMFATVEDGTRNARQFFWQGDFYQETMDLAQQLIDDGLGDVVYDFPTTSGAILSRSPRNLLSFFGPDSLSVAREEVKKLEVPLLLMLAEGDSITPAEWSEATFDAALGAGVDATYIVLPYPFQGPLSGFAAHGYFRVYGDLADEAAAWLFEKVPDAAAPATGVQIPSQEPSGNFTPIADAGPSVTGSPGTRVQLDATNSMDVDGSIAAFGWLQTGGPRVTLDDPTSATPSFDLPSGSAGLSFEVTVTDDQGATASDGTTASSLNVDNSSGGGSSLWLLSALAGLFYRRRRLV